MRVPPLFSGYAAVLLATLSSPLAAAPSGQPTLSGSWGLDVTRLPIPPEARPKSVTIAFEAASGDMWRTTVDIVGNEGTTRHMVSTCRRDGTPVAIEGDRDEADMAAVAIPAPGVLVLALSRQGVPGSTRVYSVAPDDRTMTETAVVYGDDGAPRIRTNSFNRIAH